MKWLHRTKKEKTPLAVVVDVPLPQKMVHSVTHTVKYAPKPQPNELTVILERPDGQRFHLPTITMYGQNMTPITIPHYMMTGGPEGSIQDLRLLLNFRYNPSEYEKGRF